MMRKRLAVVTFMVLASTVWVVSPRDLEGQNPVTVRAQIHAIGVDSVGNGSLITYFSLGANSVAERVHIALRQQVEVASMHGVPEFSIGVAVLDSADWESISPYPYGFPHFVGPPGSIVFTPSRRTQPENADTLLSGRADELAAVGHEVGHLLTFALAPQEFRDSLSAPQLFAEHVRDRLGRIYEVPVWYGELAANYFLTLFLRASHPEAASQWTQYLHALSASPQRKYTYLSDMVKVYTDRVGDNTPYLQTPEGQGNLGWYQGVVGEIGEYLYRADVDFVAHIRRMMSGSGPSETDDIVNELEALAPGLRRSMESFGVFPSR